MTGAAGLVFPPVNLGPVVWDFSRTYVFGVLNVTPDSFSDGGRYAMPSAALAHARALIAAGADAIDIGGESTRPGSARISAAEELRRVMPVIVALGQEACPVPLSLDTTKAEVAREALAQGVSFVNDVSGLGLDPKLAEVVAASEATLILGHLRGRPETMQDGIRFHDVVAEVTEELRDRVRLAVSAGIPAQRIWLDPGLGFGKTAAQSLALLRDIGQIRDALGYPVMVGPSRKSFIGAVTGEPVADRLLGTAAATAVAIAGGVDAVRLHDVAALRPAVAVADAIRRGGV